MAAPTPTFTAPTLSIFTEPNMRPTPVQSRRTTPVHTRIALNGCHCLSHGRCRLTPTPSFRVTACDARTARRRSHSLIPPIISSAASIAGPEYMYMSPVRCARMPLGSVSASQGDNPNNPQSTPFVKNFGARAAPSSSVVSARQAPRHTLDTHPYATKLHGSTSACPRIAPTKSGLLSTRSLAADKAILSVVATAAGGDPYALAFIPQDAHATLIISQRAPQTSAAPHAPP